MYIMVKDVEKIKDKAFTMSQIENRGRRNILSGACSCARRLCNPDNLPAAVTIDDLKPGMRVLRTVGYELGCSRFSDYRQCLHIAKIASVGKKIAIGINGERIDPTSIICIEGGDWE